MPGQGRSVWTFPVPRVLHVLVQMAPTRTLTLTFSESSSSSFKSPSFCQEHLVTEWRDQIQRPNSLQVCGARTTWASHHSQRSKLLLPASPPPLLPASSRKEYLDSRQSPTPPPTPLLQHKIAYSTCTMMLFHSTYKKSLNGNRNKLSYMMCI